MKLSQCMVIVICFWSLFLMAPVEAIQLDNTGVIEATITVEDYSIITTAREHQIQCPGYGNFIAPGKPKLPVRIFSVAIPPGAKFISATVSGLEKVDLPGRYTIGPASMPRVIGREKPAVYQQNQALYDRNYTSVYTSDKPFPEVSGHFVRQSHYRRYNLIDLKIVPFSYRPQSGILSLSTHVRVQIIYKLPQWEREVDSITDYLPRTEKVARDLILNHDEAQTWYPASAASRRGSGYTLTIITIDSLEPALSSLVNLETQKGNNPTVVLLSWITSNYTGVDVAQQIRNFLRDKYPSDQWGIENVLLVGHHDQVPMRQVWQDIGYGKPRTDFYFAELSQPDNQSWDSNQNGQFGEDSDTMDFYAEINVGRIPWSDFDTVQAICQKSVAYETNNDPTFKKSILLLGAYFWADTDNAELMEAKVDQAWMTDWNILRMYEKNSTYTSSYDCDYPLKRTNVVQYWSAGKFGFVNWAGHGSPVSSHIAGLMQPAFIHADDCPLLNDDYPAIIFADACSNSDTDYANIGRAMLKQGAVGFVGATKVALGCPGWSNPNDGSSQSLDYYFTTAVTSESATQGAAHQDALRTLYTQGLWYYVPYEMCEWTLWGNPCLSMTAVPSQTPLVSPIGLILLLGILSLVFIRSKR
ncbi:C25 family cysteine peptidase [candidate division CSSED10-310 bacterium]|uniref:C25 family cysteine peptidase n=1 Tax=candidate division CSSED10-310 bacterium TaxID=2855610 RepID=A0ABV6YVQ9_UNCC1